jgi:hypothetical protein
MAGRSGTSSPMRPRARQAQRDPGMIFIDDNTFTSDD